ncbi:hypothetical protein [Pedomonas sp. V897]|uniref:hypothetical protein n=1 Tax=Pedomonas sp. V897 TaxID=3446482 RepID=UPI003EDEC0BB
MKNTLHTSVWLYAPHHDLNDATNYYVETIGLALARIGWSLRHVSRIEQAPPQEPILVLDCKRALIAMMQRRGSPIWLWVQGVVPEEAELQRGSKFRKFYWSIFERIVLPRVNGVFMVSKAMSAHYEQKYGFRQLPVFIMPCVNQALDASAFLIPGKYSRPSFVYAGSLHKWQCFEATLQTFAEIKKARPDATLTVLTGDQAAARRMAENVGLSDLAYDYVPAHQLQSTLRNFKYGFVLREHHVVNAVATPTKVSSYMAAGVIPITTTAVRDYAEKLSGIVPVVMVDEPQPRMVAEAILAVENRALEPSAILQEYTNLFENYFDRKLYIPAIADFFCNTGLRPVA